MEKNNVTKIKVFIEVLLGMGMTKQLAIRNYCRASPFSHIAWFGFIFTQNQFQGLKGSLHLANNENDSTKEKLLKLGILPSNLNASFHKYYIPKWDLAIDKQMIGTKYWVFFIEYIPQKSC